MNTAQVLRRLVWEEWGGIETVVTSTSRALEQRGVGAEVVCTSALSAPGLEERAGLRIRRFRYGYTRVPALREASAALDRKGGNPTSLGLVAHLLTAPRLDLVSCHTMGRLGGQVRWVCARRGIPYVVTLHGGHFAVPDDERARLAAPTKASVDAGRLLEVAWRSGRYLQEASAIVALSQEELARARAELPDTPSYYLRNGVDVARFAAATAEQGAHWRAKRGIPPDAPLVLCVARLDPQKGQDRLVQACAQARTRPHVALVGPESVAGQSRMLRDLAEQCGMGARLHLIGPVRPDTEELPSAYAAADVVALASRHEPFGVVLLEGWAAGVPIVASAVGGIVTFVEHDRTGLLVADGDIGAFSAALDRALQDAPLRQRLTRAAAAEVRATYDWSAIAAELETVYSDAIKHDRQRRR